ncbi:MAG TPA: T9SS type A sorting domain-containing protein [Candidatus Saccharimonadaceae bacterium]|nr:T9SS type A sorting domain-containing protein [Candidatus Saccharimonadaceae bacterium]
MKKFAALLLVSLALTCMAATSFAANKYPPGPGGTCTDTLKISDVENPSALCHPATLDTVFGVRGIITGFDAKPSAFGLYIQNTGDPSWAGVDIFTGATNYNASVPGTPTGGNLALGDSIVIYGTTQEFPATNGTTEIEGPDVVQSTNDIIIRKISSGNALPAFAVRTSHDLNWIPGISGATAEPLEGCLVKIRGPLHIARTVQGLGVSFGTFLVVANSALSDSVMIDGNTLTTFTAPAVGTVLDSIQGILNQGTSSAGTGAVNSYRIQLRGGNDIFASVPPNVTTAFFTADNKIRVVFDRDVTQASAENVANYSLASFGSINSATQLSPTTTEVDVTSGFSQCTPDESITVNGVVSTSSGLPMTVGQTKFLATGVVPMSCVQDPDPTFLAGSPCLDRSIYAGTGTLAGQDVVTFRGVCTAANFGSVYYVDDGGARGGVGVFGPSQPLIVGHQYLIAAQIQEFGGETEANFTAFVQDEGAATPITPLVKTTTVLRDTTCDAAQNLDTGEDYEGKLVKLSYAKIVENRNPGAGFFVVSLSPPLATDTLLVSSSGTSFTFQADSLNVVDVTGILRFNSGTFRLTPRGDADIVSHGHVTSVPGPGTPKTLSFSVYPNPARTTQVSFGLPARGRVEVGVYDLQGRKLATLENGILEPGTYTRSWSGMTDGGQKVGAGVYFYRLRTPAGTRTLRSVHID